ncbi:type I polyketide synthase [Nocardia callitridis]|uniref:Polyketide synthase n=1 Tax=Nocardia callitridis TaxID=648753 RepID=A0ABP9KUS5_9NOCA
MQDDRIRDLLKKVSLELQQSRRDLAAVRQQRREPIAIVGIGCRFPGGVDGPDSFWRLLDEGRDAIGDFPADRGWDLETLFESGQEVGTSATRQGGFLDDIAGFDAGLFGLSPREALASDPQHRVLLETTWQAFEHAGIDPAGLRGHRTGVFIGTNGNDYPTTLAGYPPELEGYLAVGNAASVASGRIAYSFGLEGPALTIDTACSSALVAAHLAVRSLRERECDSAVIGGVTLMSSPTLFVEFSRQHGLSTDGRCKAFGAGADGTGWAEGVGVLVAERLSDAVAKGRRVLAVISGSAVNQDGASNGLTAPNGPAQQRVIEDALASAGLRAGEIDAVEAHGTGTVLGDPIEAHALMATYGQRREGDPLWLGSVKSNIGHTQAAAGIAGLIKMVLALGNELLPRTLHAQHPSSHIDWDSGNVRVLDTALAWPRRESARRAGISAFGVSGTNAHLIIEESPQDDAEVAPTSARPGGSEATAWLISANSPAALRTQAEQLNAATLGLDPAAIDDVTKALRGRALLNYRAVVVADGDTGRLGGSSDARGVDGVVTVGSAAPAREAGGAENPDGADGLGGSSGARGVDDVVVVGGAVPARDAGGTDDSGGVDGFGGSSGARGVDDVVAVGSVATTREASGAENSGGVDVPAGASDSRSAGAPDDHGAVGPARGGGNLGNALESLRLGLAAAAAEEVADNLVLGVATTGRRTVFVFPGQGSQWPGMAESLLETSPEFATYLDECEAALAPFVDWSLREVLTGAPGAPDLDRVDVVQPVLWAMMVSLAKLWIHLGVRPDAVIGHSQGEIAAAHIAGVLSLADSARVVALRSKAITALSGRGAMLSLSLTESDARARLAGWTGKLAVAAVNGPTAVLVSGDSAAVDEFAAELERDGVWNRRVNVDYASHSHHVDAIETTVREQLAPIIARPATLAVVSTVTGAPIDTTVLGADYWYTNLRSPVLFDTALRHLLAEGYDTAIEVSAHPVLRHNIDAIADDVESASGEDSAFVSTGTLRRDRSGRHELLLAAARLYVRGIEVEWSKLLSSGPARWIDLPTYAFDRQRFWGADDSVAGIADARRLGVRPAEHPLLGGVVEISASGATLFVGQLTLAEHPWLADHRVGDTVIVPGAACVDIALWIGAELGWPVLAELVNERPIVVPASGRVRVQVYLAPEEDGRRRVTFFTGEQSGDLGGDWQQCASGVVAVADPVAAPSLDSVPSLPPGDPTTIYRELGELGLNYGPAFQGLRAVSGTDDVIRATAVLAESFSARASFSIHPALLDAALHAIPYRGGELALPFSWSGVRLWASDARELAVEVTRIGEHAYRVVGVDSRGGPVLSIDSVTLRPTETAHVGTIEARPYRVGWQRLPIAEHTDSVSAVLWTEAPERYSGSNEVPLTADLSELSGECGLVLLNTSEFASSATHSNLPDDVHAITERTLDRLRTWLADGPDTALLVVLTREAQVVGEDDRPDLRFGAIAGLVRSAQAENPGRFVLLDHDGTTDRAAIAMVAATIIDADESEAAVRAGQLISVPRLAPSSGGAHELSPADRPVRGTAVVIGGLGLLGRLTARKLVELGEASSVVLVSRRGTADEQAGQARAELESVGAAVRIVACDATDRAQLAAVLDAIPADQPLTTVVHAAGSLADQPVHALTPEALHEVLRAKVDIAWNLHELTVDADLRSFLLFSSAAGTLGIAGQSNYASGNTFLDALAGLRRRQGSAASSLAWGLWETTSAMTGHLRAADHQRLARQGVRPLTLAKGEALLDYSLRAGAVDLVPVELVTTPWQETMSPLLRGALRYRPRLRQAATGGEVDSRGLRALSDRDRVAAVQKIVREQAAAVLGYDDIATIAATGTFKELGMDSLTAVDLRNRLTRAVGVRLAATIVFDHPTPAALAAKISVELAGTGAAQSTPPRAEPKAVADEPIAIVGMGCRYPGGVRSAEDLWKLVSEGVDAIGPWPTDRGWDIEDPEDGSYVRAGGFVSGMADFDAGLFGMSPREALATDPQQRQLLEVTWETLENAGIDPQTLRGSNTGVYTGIMYNDYATRLASTPEDLEAYLVNGSAASVASGRVAYTFGLEGPAVSVDTACSSSLVSMHLAVSALRGGECDLALAGGVTLLSSPASIVGAARMGALSADGRCRSFGAGADGTGWAEGVGVVLLERLSDAVAGGRVVLGVVRGSAVNQDGGSNGLTAPSGVAQQRVIRRALGSGGLGVGDVDVVEGHGTGTSLGDPIEANALLETYGRRESAEPLYVGSLKSNIGHSQAAAGVGGVIKMVQALRHGVLPASLHADEPSGHVDWSSGGVRVLSRARAWPETGRARRAGVSAFGVSGTNAHIILEQAPSAPADSTDTRVGTQSKAESDSRAADPIGKSPTNAAPTAIPATDRQQTTAWVISGHTEAALRRQAGNLAEHLVREPHAEPAAVARSLLTSRAQLTHRAVVIGDTVRDFETRLRAFGGGEDGDTVHGVAKRGAVLGVLFTGQGSQRAGMGSELAQRFPVFAESYERILTVLDQRLSARISGDRALDDRVTGSFLEAVRAQPDAASPARSTLDQTVFTQPALFAFEVALFELLESWGVRPDYVCGHSIGEIAAAHVAGVLTLDASVELVIHRATGMQALPPVGAMLAAEISADELDAVAPTWRAELDLAAVNSPGSIVLSGEEVAIERLCEAIRAQGRRVRKLDVSHAFHSRCLDPMLAEFEKSIAALSFEAPRIPLVSTVTGKLADREIRTPEYWVRQVRSPVLFADTVGELARLGVTDFVELGPDAHLTPQVVATLANGTKTGATPTVTATVRRDRAEPETVLAAAGRLEIAGARIDWGHIVGVGGTRTKLPTYSFERDRYWLPPGPALLGKRQRGATSEAPPSNIAGPVGNTGATAIFGQPEVSENARAEPKDDAHPSVLTAEVLLDTVVRAVAEVLGLAGGTSLDPTAQFAELGMTSMAAVELTEKLRVRTGVALPPSAPIEFPTASTLAEHLLASSTSDPVDAAAASLSGLYLQLNRSGRIPEAAALIIAASHTRRSFDSAEHREATPPPIQLATGTEDLPLVVCFPALTAMSGPHEFAGFAKAIGADFPVYAMEAPGYRPDSALPKDLRAYLDSQTAAVAELVGDRDFVVVGRSLGGSVAHAIAAELSTRHRSPLGLALIDSYPMDTPTLPDRQWWMPALIEGMLRRIDDLHLDLSPNRLTTMGAYLRITNDLVPEPITPPTLLVRALDRLPGMPTGADEPWQADWPFAEQHVDVAGDHYSVLEDGSAATAEAVAAWIRTLERTGRPR